MFTKSLAKAFFIVALLLLLILVGVSVSENMPTDKSKLSCRLDALETNLKSEQKMAWVSKNRIVLHDIAKGSLVNLNWKVEKGNLTLNEVSDVSLFCEQPDYNCFLRTVDGNNTELELLYFKPPYGIVKAHFGSVQKVFPIYWDARKFLRVGSPIQMCGHTINRGNYEMGLFENSLFVYHNSTNLLASYDLSNLKGAGPKSAPHEPTELMSVSSSGLLSQADCKDSRSSTRSLFWLRNDRSFLFFSPGHAINLYGFEKSLKKIPFVPPTPGFSANYAIIGSDRFQFLSNDLLVTFKDGNIESKENSRLNGILENLEKNETPLFWDDRQRVFSADRHRWLSSQSVNLISLAPKAIDVEKLKIKFDWLSRADAFSKNIFSDDKKLFRWQQSDFGTVNLSMVSCD